MVKHKLFYRLCEEGGLPVRTHRRSNVARQAHVRLTPASEVNERRLELLGGQYRQRIGGGATHPGAERFRVKQQPSSPFSSLERS